MIGVSFFLVSLYSRQLRMDELLASKQIPKCLSHWTHGHLKLRSAFTRVTVMTVAFPVGIVRHSLELEWASFDVQVACQVL